MAVTVKVPVPPAVPGEGESLTHTLLPGDASAFISPSARAPNTASADATAIRRWLTPQTLRSQFILTELLHPPLALRDDPRFR